MANPVFIDSLDHPTLQPFTTLRRAVEHRRRGIFVAEGGAVVERLLESPLEVLALLLSPAWYARLLPALERRSPPPAVYLAEHRLLERLVGFPLHQGAMALAQVPPPRPLAAVLAGARRPLLLLALDDLTNSENVGTMVRSAAAFGVTAVISGETCASPWLRRAVRASMGAVFALPIVEVDDLPATFVELREAGVMCFAASPHAAHFAADLDLAADVCVVIGHEGRGVRPAVAAACLSEVAIPMAPGIDSLNAAAAAAVLLYEVVRQRRYKS